jgi:hypothetical protein
MHLTKDHNSIFLNMQAICVSAMSSSIRLYIYVSYRFSVTNNICAYYL